MKKNRLFMRTVLLAVLFMCMGQCSRTAEPLHPVRIMTFNIRLNTPVDGLNAWPYRKDPAAGMIRFHHADIAGVQEALAGQVHDLAERLPEYGWIGVGRDDGKEAGEFMAVFYLKNRFRVLKDSTFWLSEHPDRPGRGWDAACNRVVTCGRFEDLQTGKIFYLFNTHFDHRGETARRESAKLLLSAVRKIAGGSDAVVTGDFNAAPEMIPIQIVTGHHDSSQAAFLVDSKTVSIHPHQGPSGTFTGFQQAEDEPIDYIFITRGVTVLNHATLSDQFDGRFPSDHYPVLAEVVME